MSCDLLEENLDYPNVCKNIILDIDNCVLDSREWEKYIPKDNSREGWDNYQQHYYLTEPNQDMALFLSRLHLVNGLKTIYFITAREDISDLREITINHLNHALGEIDGWDKIEKRLFMRNPYDYSSTSDVKANILRTHIYPFIHIDLAIDDDIRNIEMYKNFGIQTLHYTKYNT